MKLFKLKEKTKRHILTFLCGVGLTVSGLLAGLALDVPGTVQLKPPSEGNTQLSAESPVKPPVEPVPPATGTDAVSVTDAGSPENVHPQGAEVYAANTTVYVLLLENEGMLTVMERNAAFGSERKLMELSFEAAELDDAEREELSRGMEFETLSKIDEYLESAES